MGLGARALVAGPRAGPRSSLASSPNADAQDRRTTTLTLRHSGPPRQPGTRTFCASPRQVISEPPVTQSVRATDPAHL
eukprot:XP_001689611.1 predicted protein [Chlamydomonas reinhardtii]